MRKIIKQKLEKRLSREEFDDFKKGHYVFNKGKGRFFKYLDYEATFNQSLFDKLKEDIDTMLVDEGYLIKKIDYYELEAIVEKNPFDFPFEKREHMQYEIKLLFVIKYHIEVFNPNQ